MDCGPTSLRIVAACYGTLQSLRGKCQITHEGVSLLEASLTPSNANDFVPALPAGANKKPSHEEAKPSWKLTSLTKTQKGTTKVTYFSE